ncbi:MAG: GDSL-type esterase/lipase family protein [Myxococcales bacterium]|nr:GDSL-type esterase/lipase family protein [Myxococcales bacterium]
MITLVLLEMSLQGIALVVKAGSHRGTAGWQTSNLRILCMGDSHTYGMWVKQEEAWPVELEKQWNASVDQPKVEVINLGFPGTTSTRLLKNLPKALETFKPDFLFVMIGVNDWWHPPVVTEHEPHTWTRVVTSLYHNVRILKFVYMWQRRFYDPSLLEVDQEHRGAELPDEKIAAFDKFIKVDRERRVAEPRAYQVPIQYGDLTFDLGSRHEWTRQTSPVQVLSYSLREIPKVAAAYGVKLVYVNYPYDESHSRRANRLMRRIGREDGVPVFDVTKEFYHACPTGLTRNCPELFVPDNHPSAAGHELAAHQITAQFHALVTENVMDD